MEIVGAQTSRFDDIHMSCSAAVRLVSNAHESALGRAPAVTLCGPSKKSPHAPTVLHRLAPLQYICTNVPYFTPDRTPQPYCIHLTPVLRPQPEFRTDGSAPRSKETCARSSGVRSAATESLRSPYAQAPPKVKGGGMTTSADKVLARGSHRRPLDTIAAIQYGRCGI